MTQAELIELERAYMTRFNLFPPRLFPPDFETQAALIRMALDRGSPIEDDETPTREFAEV